jgi:hypothetical protein
VAPRRVALTTEDIPTIPYHIVVGAHLSVITPNEASSHPLTAFCSHNNNINITRHIMSVPIYAYDDAREPVVGLALLFSESQRTYGSMDILVAEHIATTHRQSLSRIISRVLNGSPGSPALPEISQLASGRVSIRNVTATRASDSRFDTIPATSEDLQRIPDVALMCHDIIQHTLQCVVAFTPCWLASFRALSRDHSYLVRLLSYRDSKNVFDPTPLIALSDYKQSLNAYAARYAVPLLVENYTTPNWTKLVTQQDSHALEPLEHGIKTDTNTRSSLTLPVTVGSRLYGVFHFESMYECAFGTETGIRGVSGFVPAIRQMISLVSNHFALAANRLAPDSAIRYGSVWLSAHSISHAHKQLDAVRSLVHKSNTRAASDAVQIDGTSLLAHLDRASILLDDARELLIYSDREPKTPRTVKQLLDKHVARRLISSIHIIHDDPLWHMKISPPFVRPISVIVEELCDNICNAVRGRDVVSHQTRHYPVEFSINMAKIGGVDYIRIFFTNDYVPILLPQNFQDSVFERRLGNSETGNWGTLSIASLAHSIGGTLYLMHFDDKKHRLTIALQLPLHVLETAHATCHTTS